MILTGSACDRARLSHLIQAVGNAAGITSTVGRNTKQYAPVYATCTTQAQMIEHTSPSET